VDDGARIVEVSVCVSNEYQCQRRCCGCCFGGLVAGIGYWRCRLRHIEPPYCPPVTVAVGCLQRGATAGELGDINATTEGVRHVLLVATKRWLMGDV